MKAEVRDYEKLVYICEPGYDKKTETLTWCGRSWNGDSYIKSFYSQKDHVVSCSDSDRIMSALLAKTDCEIVEYACSPEGTYIAFVGAERKAGEKVPASWKAPISAQGNSYRKESDGGWKIDRTWFLCVFDRQEDEICTLHESFEALHAVCWSPDESRIFFEDDGKDSSYFSVSFEKNGERQEPVCLSEDIHAVLGGAGILCMEDGKTVLAAGQKGTETVVGYELFCLAADGSGEIPAVWQGDVPDEVFPQIINGSPFQEKNCRICAVNRADTAAVIGSEAGQIAVYLVTMESEQNGVKGTWKRLTDGTGSYFSICTGEEDALYATRSDWNHPARLVKISLTDGSWMVTCDPNPWIAGKNLAETTEFRCRTLDGAADLDGWVLEPADRRTEKIPTVLLIHGGPLSAYADAFTMEAQLLAAAGMGVILVNPRGSSGYGKPFASYEKAFDGIAATDLLYYVDCALRAFPWMDETRLGVAGGSYGGYMAAWLAGHCKRFQAAVVMRGLLNFEFLCLTSQAAGMPGMLEEPRDFEDFLMKMTEDSPTTYAQEMDIPMLIMHGEKDVNTPVYGAHQLYVAVKDTHPDLPVRLILFPGVGHNIRAARLDYYQRYEQELVNWMKKYLNKKSD